jgi:HK97 gp10 family phage protein
VKVTGADRIQRALAKFGQRGAEITADVIQATAMQVNTEAKQQAPANYGKLRQSIINNVSDHGLRVAIEVGVKYGAFVEFGTGVYVQVPAELQQEALKFKGMKTGSFSDFLKTIEDWCKRKGISEDAAYPIAMSILKKGVKPQPYLYPAYVKYRKEIKPRLEKALNRLINQTK